MNIVIDFLHPADINFYKNAIYHLQKKGINISVIIRPRENIIDIFKKELPNIPFKSIGKHYSSLLPKIYGIIERDLELLFHLRKIDFDAVTSFSGFYIAQASHILRKPSVLFYDDYEYKLNFNLCKFSASRFVIMPKTIPVTGKNIIKYKSLKELAYLHPRYFKPNKKILEQYKLRPQEYVFIRETAKTSLNYKSSSAKLLEITDYLKELGFQIVVSLENKSLIERFKENCIILKEPVEDIYSLLSFAALTISSGDTMARESCLVGTPTIYTGGRDMYANDELIRKDCMFKVEDIEKVPITINYILENDLKKEVEKTIRRGIKYDWDDTTEVIVENLVNSIIS